MLALNKLDKTKIKANLKRPAKKNVKINFRIRIKIWSCHTSSCLNSCSSFERKTRARSCKYCGVA